MTNISKIWTLKNWMIKKRAILWIMIFLRPSEKITLYYQTVRCTSILARNLEDESRYHQSIYMPASYDLITKKELGEKNGLFFPPARTELDFSTENF